VDPSTISTIADLLAASGPYGLVCVLAWAFWRVNEKKDRQLRALYDQVVELSETQTAAITKVEAALVALKEAIADLRRG